jgi:thiamine kinase-like enzyme
MDDMDEVRRIAAGVAGLAGFDGPFERLGGLTNRVYRAGALVLRLPGPGTEAYIDRVAEAAMARAAAQAGVAPEVRHAGADGIMVTRALDGVVTMTPAGFRDRPGAVARAARALRQLHRSGVSFPARFDLFAMIDNYLTLLRGRDVTLPEGYHQVLADTAPVRAALAAHPLPSAPCHCDPLCENFLDAGDRMWIVDWEYAGMNDPMWDLGDLSVEAGLDAGQDAELVAAYFDGPAPPAALGRIVIYKAMCDLLWTLWGLIQLADRNPADDFRAYADGRFARCRALMTDPAFADHVAAVARG